ncbi:MAG: NAD(P)/FAD-dependent oxidoreductase [Candidatus Omnitrophica bacterium]|nr:NAD(P)/FAD-dependent oxidoreductase [Candidatus Omnitrophota bacterium]
MSEHYDYDAIIIGAGISGLVCGCYLAKAGFKTLILEQHVLAGGYCTSFKREGYNFDSAIHYFGGLKTGSLHTIIEELGIINEFKFNQLDPSDRIIIPNNEVLIRSNIEDTVIELKKSWKEESTNIDAFFEFITATSIATLYRKTIDISFSELLSNYFRNSDLKSVISILLHGNMGLPPSKISAFVAIVFMREFLLDAGYYPEGGMQSFSNYLVSKFINLKGEIRLSSKVTEIITKFPNVHGIIGEDGKKISSKYVVSCIDANQTFNSLIPSRTSEKEKVNRLEISSSVFIVYLGLENDTSESAAKCCNTWYFKESDVDAYHNNLLDSFTQRNAKGILVTFPCAKNNAKIKHNKHTLQIFISTPSINEDFWINNKESISANLISTAEEIIPNLRKNINLSFSATPATLKKYTLNTNGASFGWASTINQTNSFVFPQTTSFENLILAGHWVTMGSGQGGISTVALSGKKAAEIIVSRLKNN